MRRLSLAVLVLVALVLLPAGASASDTLLAQEPAVEAPADIGPDERDESERIAETEKGIEDEAWTFKYLVPSALALSAVVIVVTIIWYGLRVQARYRVAK